MTQVHAAMNDPVARRLLESANPARLAYVAHDGTPRVVPVVSTGMGPVGHRHDARLCNGCSAGGQPRGGVDDRYQPPVWPPNVLLIRGTAKVSSVDGVFPEYVEGARKLTPVEEFPQWVAGVHALYDQMARIDITATWVRIQDFETRIPQAVEDLARIKSGER